MNILWVHKNGYDIQPYLDLVGKCHKIFVFENYLEAWTAIFTTYYNTFDLILCDLFGDFSWIEYDSDVESGLELYRNIESDRPFIFIYRDNVELNFLKKLKVKKNTSNLFFLRIPYTSSELLNIIDNLSDSKNLIDDSSQIIKSNTQLIYDFKTIYSELTKQLKANPKLSYQIEPRKFEELIAYLLEQSGYNIELTKSSRDGGKDIYALQKTMVGNILAVVECKRYSKNNLVGIDIVQRLYGVKIAEKANVGMVITTSSYTKPAINFQKTVGTELALKDYHDLIEWINLVKKKNDEISSVSSGTL